MALDNFRKIQIILNRADEPIYRKLIASEGDRNGRELEVQLTNHYVLADLPGVKLRLYWKHSKLGNQGIEPFQAVDSSKGLFKVTYPNTMLNVGNVNCSIEIQDGNKFTRTRTFTVLVEGSGFNAQTAIASDDYQALNEALIKIQKYQTQIDSIKADLVRQGENLIGSERTKFEQLFNEIQPQMDGLEQQFNDAMANLTQDSEVIAGRTSTTTGESYSTIGKRLDEMEVMTVLENHKAYFEIKDGRPRLRLEEI